ncbi:MAG: nitrate reductase cytochrome c-type subunit [Halomonas sp.]|jgi:cytochrome c-type protein NapB|uniref:nitrate reductase cytochrome c-type subunit n=1 Tax=Halomonas sp. MCCC 1A11057 TaxID=2733482 RepID=UPI001F3EEB59|nr:nitrate reductase cytochrome c-type subunit [Halomonas sp. MCCC 1A11057]MCE8035547.1 nitrate reductase cytochrome c-type subunit [Halomonas sp. MCCC 1A11057]MDX5432123.1 nitrate reductase cytochrome c-type subunit [Halomonas sp.]
MRLVTILSCLAAFMLPTLQGLAAEGELDPLRANAPLLEEREPEPLYGVEDRSLRPVREYPMQPPTIPHRIDNYQVDLNANRCMACHARTRVGETQAIMVSVTHYMDREGNFLGDLSPRRYFCTQCHVPQTDAPSRVGNTFVDMSDLIRGSRQRSE